MSVKIVIPSRFGSSRLKGKPLLSINGKPMVLHVVERCLEAGFSKDDIFVATDDRKIQLELEKSDVQAILTSVHHTSGTERLNEVAELKCWNRDDIIINVQGDEPMIPPLLINSVSKFTLDNPSFDICTAVVPVRSLEEFENPNVVKAILGNAGRALYFTRSSSPLNRDNQQDITLAMRHVGIYAYRVSALNKFCTLDESLLENYEKLEQLRALSHGMSIGAFVFEGNVPHGVDTVEDYEAVKQLMECN